MSEGEICPILTLLNNNNKMNLDPYHKCIKDQCAIFNRKVKMCGFAFVLRIPSRERIEDEHVPIFGDDR